MTENSTADTPPANAESKKATLLTLAPGFEETEHRLYVEHLLAGLRQPANRNIALTGPYGSGKSSILDKVVTEYPGLSDVPPDDTTEDEKRGSGNRANRLRSLKDKLAKWGRDRRQRVAQERRILRVSISTLGPGAEYEPEVEDDNAETTNRIQKELVKHLLYRVEPGEIPGQRFPQRARPTSRRIAWEAACFAILLTAGLWLFGVRPDLSPPGTSLPWWLSALVLGGIGAVTFSAARWHFTGKPIQQFSAAGASISFDKKTDSVFDKYLDEIVRFFEVAKTEVVIFEDLDRFETPEIFDSLRELNGLLNESAVLRSENRTLHFVYAVKDSMFEKIVKTRATTTENQGNDAGGSELSLNDAAKAEIERANRTKFFELVVPVVPFLSSNNARDLFGTILEDLERPDNDAVSRGLIDVVARHTTDMRLLRNIRNEFVVFAQRLLRTTGRAPGITADAVFALVAYKNFHMSDYEAIFHRESKLDDLERARRNVVEDAIQRLQSKKNALAVSGERAQRQKMIASQLGDKLRTHLAALPTNSLEGAVTIVGDVLDLHRFGEVATWRSIIANGVVRVECEHSPSRHRIIYDLDQEVLETLFSEAFEPGLWDEITLEVLAEDRSSIEQKISDLRGADFATIWSLLGTDDVSEANVAFRKAITDDLGSDLARDLVRRGYINKYFAEYASVFHGKFIGVEVAKFFRNCVRPNEMEVDFPLEADDVANVFAEAPEDFLRSRSALNLDIVKQQLRKMTNNGLQSAKVSDLAGRRVREILGFAIGDAGMEGAHFLYKALRRENDEREAFVKVLAELHWDSLFNEITEPDVGDGVNDRIRFTDIALQSISDTKFHLDQRTLTFLAENHAEFTAFSEGPKSGDQSEHFTRMHDLAVRAQLIVPNLGVLALPLANRFIIDRAFALTAENLRFALANDASQGLTLDRIRLNEHVWARCTEDLGNYFDAIAAQSDTPWAILDPNVLTEILNEHVDGDDAALVCRVLASSAPEARLLDIETIEESQWGAVLEAELVESDVSNLIALLESESVSERQVSKFLKTVDTIIDREASSDPEHEAQVDDRKGGPHRLSVLLLNHAIPDLDQAIAFARQLGVTKENISIGDLEPQTPGLLAKLLTADMVKDDAPTFERFSDGGWEAIASGVQISRQFDAFMTPELLLGLAGDLLNDSAVSDGLKRRVLDDLDEYIPEAGDDEVLALRTAARVARALGVQVSTKQLSRMARSGAEAGDVIVMIGSNPSLSADEIVSVLGDLGGDWIGFTEQSLTEKFEVPDIEGLSSILRRCRQLSNGIGVRQRTQKFTAKRSVWFES